MPERGRPTEYNESVLEKAREYFISGWQEDGDVIPSIEGLALYLGLTRPTIYDWKKHEDKQDFSYIVEQILILQSKKLFTGGLTGDFNSSIAKLMLTKHGYSDKIETDITSKGEKIFDTHTLTDEELAHIAGRSTTRISEEGTSTQTP